MVFNLMKRLKNWHTYFIRMYNENPKLPDTNSHCDLSTKPEIGRSYNESTISNNIMLFLCTYLGHSQSKKPIKYSCRV